ncbi:unnamed protein product [Rotaria sp. Silwood1]|nr:unnamed protein product [Rotaria sp. Silwood1]CAF0746450.1 unnamed protein product [Rotaria sp. Silwood1]CAF3328513.1 unnamed protein product [Rotaria sp. Silwood1]CAF3337052.1 unnamed protein product [Rotaria sp. Silwood1]CAF4716541.1 unnamed protein product [Rotaria sp. Silwood1]
MPTTLSSDRYSAVSSSSTSSTSSSSCYNNNNNNNNNHNHNNSSLSQSSRSSSTFLPLRSAKSSFHLSKSNNTNYHSMQSLKIRQQYKTNHTPVARISPLVINQQLSSNEISKQHDKDDGWLSCEELETIEKRFTDLLQEPNYKKPIILNNYQQQEQQRAKSCDRLAMDDEDYKPTTLPVPRKSLISKTEDKDLDNNLPLPASIIYDNNTRPRSQTPHHFVSSSTRTVLSANDILKVESSYRSIGTQVFACRCLCDLYITTTDRLAKLEDWILFQHGLPVWLLNSGTDPKRQSRLSLIIAEHGSGFPVWQDTINGFSDVKQARAQHITFRLSDQITLAVLRFNDLSASKDFYSYYQSIRNDKRYEHLFSTIISNRHHRSSSCGSILRKHRKNQNINKSSISNPCQFQHITCLQVKDRVRLISLDQCLIPSQNYSNQHI